MLRTQLDNRVGAASSLSDAVEVLADEESLFFSQNFLLQRPILRSFLSEKRSVLLIDEIDRSDDEFEALLLECLSEFQVSVPELGVLKAINKPLTILTSNGTRMISDALRRRCLYLYIDYPELDREVQIVRARFPEICEDLATQMVTFLRKAREKNLRKPPSISETLDWAEVLSILHVKKLTKDVVANTIGVISKHQADLQPVIELAAEELG